MTLLPCSAHWFLAIVCFPGMEGPAEVKYVPSKVETPCEDLPNVPTPPQPTDDNMEDMEEENEVRSWRIGRKIQLL